MNTSTRATIASEPPIFAMRRWSGVGPLSTLWIISAMFPSSVRIPVSTTTAAPRPIVTAVPM